MKLKYTNERGDSIIIGRSPPYFASRIYGFSEVDNVFNSQQSPYQDGVTVTSASLGARHLTIEGEFLTSTQKGRNKLLKVFNPKLAGVLRYEREGTVREIACIPEKGPVIASSTLATVKFTIYLMAAHPFWSDTAEVKTDIAVWHPLFEFPLEIPEEGIEMGSREESLFANIYNAGDVSCGLVLQFRATATVENPSLFNVNTREFFKLNKTMEAGEVITIETTFGGKKAVLEKSGTVENVFKWIDLDSTFLQLAPGDNLFRYDADAGLESLDVSIWHAPLYAGV